MMKITSGSAPNGCLKMTPIQNTLGVRPIYFQVNIKIFNLSKVAWLLHCKVAWLLRCKVALLLQGCVIVALQGCVIASVEFMKDREYLGSVQAIHLNGDYTVLQLTGMFHKGSL
jgi:hypothetical protein